MAEQAFSGIWRSHYRYPSSSRKREFENDHVVRIYQHGKFLVVESVPGSNESYLILNLSIDDNVATGSWQEHTNPSGYYKGALYHGAIQLAISPDRKSMKGKWVGFGKNMVVNTGPWSFTYIGSVAPKTPSSKPAAA